MSDWRFEAACLEEDPELFFPVGNTGPAVQQIEDAKAVCRRCDVVLTCLNWAIDTRQDAGVWGALSEDERRSLKRRESRGRGKERPPHTEFLPQPERKRAPDPDLVAADDARDIVSAARGTGMTWVDLARATGLSTTTLRELTTGERSKVTPAVHEQLLEYGRQRQAVDA